VFDRLRNDPGGPPAEALSTPLMVALARAAHHAGTGTLIHALSTLTAIIAGFSLAR
jgi:hypothetical protein